MSFASNVDNPVNVDRNVSSPARERGHARLHVPAQKRHAAPETQSCLKHTQKRPLRLRVATSGEVPLTEPENARAKARCLQHGFCLRCCVRRGIESCVICLTGRYLKGIILITGRGETIMWARFKPLTNKIADRLGNGRDLAGAAVETVVEQPEEVEPHLPPIFLPDQLGKATQGSPGHQALEAEIAQATRTELVHTAVLRHTLENCLVHPAGIDFAGGSFRIHPLKLLPLATSRIERVPRALYCMSGVSHTFFGHWLQDACPTALLQKEGEALLLTNPPAWQHAGQYVQAFGFRPQLRHLLYVDQLTVYEDHGQGSSKRRRYAELRRRLEVAYPGSSQGGSRVYFRRGATGIARLIANEDAVIDSLKARGFEVFDLLGASAQDIINRFRHADFVVSVDGSHLNHLYFTMQSGAKMMTFVPANRFTMNQVGYCTAAGLRYGFMVAEPAAAGYVVSIPEMNATLDLMGI